MIILETDRIMLRNIISKDAEIMYDYRNNEICSRYQRGQTKDINGIRQLIEIHKMDEINDKKPFIISIELKSAEEMIGEIVVMPNEMTFSIGYTISYKYHRKGYAYEALNILIHYLHNKYPNWEFISFTDKENVPSMNLLIKLGYENLGYIFSIKSYAFGKWLKESTLKEFSNKKI